MIKKQRRGNLYRRGKVFWLKYMVAGKMMYQSLETESRAEAIRKQGKLMRPIAAAENVDALAVIAKRLDAAKTEQEKLTDEAIRR